MNIKIQPIKTENLSCDGCIFDNLKESNGLCEIANIESSVFFGVTCEDGYIYILAKNQEMEV